MGGAVETHSGEGSAILESHRETVLIVDDDADMRRLLSVLLQTAGRRVLTAANGEEALRVLQGDTRPCVILLDLMMPVMNGPEFRRRQLADPVIADIPVVLISALNDVVEHAETLRAEGYIKKPFDPDAVVDASMICRCPRNVP